MDAAVGDVYLVITTSEGYDRHLGAIGGHDIFEPRACRLVKQLQGRLPAAAPRDAREIVAREEYLLIEVLPPYGYDGTPISHLIIRPRNRSVILSPFGSWTTSVSVRLARSLVTDLAQRNDFDPNSETEDIAASASLYRRLEDALWEASHLRRSSL